MFLQVLTKNISAISKSFKLFYKIQKRDQTGKQFSYLRLITLPRLLKSVFILELPYEISSKCFGSHAIYIEEKLRLSPKRSCQRMLGEREMPRNHRKISWGRKN